VAEAKPTLDEWRRLYKAAMRLKDLAPWKWMEETDLFGVQNPETSELGFASIMGQLGEHLALALYLGQEGLSMFWNYEAVAAYAPAEELLEIPHLQASFEDRDQLSERDRQVIKGLGLKFRGRQAWPMFRSYRPGSCPYYLEPAEARFLTCALEQAAELAPRVGDNPELLNPPGEDTYLVRVPREEAGRLVWEDRVQTVPLVEPEPISIPMDLDLLEALKELPQTLTLEADLFLAPICIGERDTRPYFPYMLMAVEAEHGFVLASELMEPRPTPQAAKGQVPLKLVSRLTQLGSAPREVRVRTPLLFALLQPLAEEVGFQLTPVSAMPMLDEAKEFMLSRLS